MINGFFSYLLHININAWLHINTNAFRLDVSFDLYLLNFSLNFIKMAICNSQMSGISGYERLNSVD